VTLTVTINRLPDEVLLEIFDLYRKGFGRLRDWNNKNGWFRLAHVCRNWRFVVLASPSRLQVRLYFAHSTPTRAVVLERLSHLPIIVDYTGAVFWEGSQDSKRFLSAIRFPDRVCRIKLLQTTLNLDGIVGGLASPFSALESLDIQNKRVVQPISLPTSLATSAGSLRHLRLVGAFFTSILPVLSATRALVYLTLDIDTVLCLTTGASLLAHLQHMPHLRNLQVTAHFHFSNKHIENTSTTALLPELTCFRFFGERAQIEWLVAGLVTPSLRELYISTVNWITDASPTFQISYYLSNFIRVGGGFFLAAQLSVSLDPKISLLAHPNSIGDPPSKSVTISMLLAFRLRSTLSATFGTLEDIFLFHFDDYAPGLFEYPKFYPRLTWRTESWRLLFEDFRNVKVLRLHHGLETNIATILRRPNVTIQGVNPDATTLSGAPINSNESQFNLDIFPSLEEIVVYAKTPDASIDERERASALESFRPFASSRYQVGRPVKVFWGTGGVHPRYCVS
jgi:hypothetical protein